MISTSSSCSARKQRLKPDSGGIGVSADGNLVSQNVPALPLPAASIGVSSLASSARTCSADCPLRCPMVRVASAKAGPYRSQRHMLACPGTHCKAIWLVHLCYDTWHLIPYPATRGPGGDWHVEAYWGLIHATPVAMQPVVEAFRHGWTDADTFSVLDDALSTDLARAGTLNAALKRRTARPRLGVCHRHWHRCDFIHLLSFRRGYRCSRPCLPMPVLKPNEAMFEEALRLEATSAYWPPSSRAFHHWNKIR